jgi:hypothetical protein
MIDRHNRCRQEDLQLEHKVKTMTWSRRVNLSILEMCIVDAYLVFKSVACNKRITQRYFELNLRISSSTTTLTLWVVVAGKL